MSVADGVFIVDLPGIDLTAIITVAVNEMKGPRGVAYIRGRGELHLPAVDGYVAPPIMVAGGLVVCGESLFSGWGYLAEDQTTRFRPMRVVGSDPDVMRDTLHAQLRSEAEKIVSALLRTQQAAPPNIKEVPHD